MQASFDLELYVIVYRLAYRRVQVSQLETSNRIKTANEIIIFYAYHRVFMRLFYLYASRLAMMGFSVNMTFQLRIDSF